MDFSRSFKAIWWFLLLLVMGFYLFTRFEQISKGSVTWFDGLIFLSWLGIALGPLFKEIEIFGFKLKAEIKDLKEHVTHEVGAIRNQIRVNSESIQTLSPSFTFGYPPPDSQLNDIESRIRQVIEEVMVGREKPPKDVETFIEDPRSPDIDVFLKARYSIEKEIRQIYELCYKSKDHRRMPIHRVIKLLVDNSVLDESLARAVKEVYSVCSPAVHGEEVSDAQVEFVRNTAPKLISALKSISSKVDWEYCT